MLEVKADEWWLETSQRLEATGEVITWAVFSRDFIRKYYPEYVRGKKEIEFLELKQGNLPVIDYAAKFVELEKFYPHYNGATAEFLKCIKFENGLRPNIQKAIGYQKIRNFPDLIDNCRIYEQDNNAHYMILNEKRGKHQQNRGKPYDAPAGKGKQKLADEVKRFFCCGKIGHTIAGCKHKEAIFFNCGEEGHICSQFQKLKKTQSGGKVFALAGTQTTNEDKLIRGTCFINSTHLITIIDIGSSHCFIIVDCVDK
ncbi:uncharacterized protein LOC131653664 [Vicia villosa]|uniref:uncharacterized protein LOC131653664 n=1 Tax=Vicia villosa TaxID=3911 RepID=UPI00273AEB09|nr:uncharacterized protein LOC131653664 [Vicia villosa]